MRDKTDPDKSFERASETWVKEIKGKADWNADSDIVIVKKFTKEEDFVAAWKEINGVAKERMDSVETGAIFSHATLSGFEFPNGTLTRQEIDALPKLDWMPTGKLFLQGCNTGSLANRFAVSQGITVAGQVGYAYFSESPTRYIQIDRKGRGTSKQVYLNSYNRGRNFALGDGRVNPPQIAIPPKPLDLP